MSADWLRRPHSALAILAVGLTGAARAGVTGTRAGHNLFHSFESLSLAKGEQATFSGPVEVRALAAGRSADVPLDPIRDVCALDQPANAGRVAGPAGAVFAPCHGAL